MFRRQFIKIVGLALAAGLALGAPAQAADRVKVGITGGEDEQIWEKVRELAKADGIEIELVVFSDYLLPNEALNAGDLDLNAFQHVPYLDNQIKTKGYDITPIGTTIVTPIGLYSTKVKAFKDLPDGATIGIPNDPSNGGRGLLLLQAQGAIKLRDGTGITPSVADIVENKRKFRIKELDAAQISRSLPDLDAAVINTNYALQAGLKPRTDAIAIEARENNPYANVIAARTKDKDNPLFARVVKVYHQQAVRDFIEKTFDGNILPAW